METIDGERVEVLKSELDTYCAERERGPTLVDQNVTKNRSIQSVTYYSREDLRYSGYPILASRTLDYEGIEEITAAEIERERALALCFALGHNVVTGYRVEDTTSKVSGRNVAENLIAVPDGLYAEILSDGQFSIVFEKGHPKTYFDSYLIESIGYPRVFTHLACGEIAGSNTNTEK